MSYSAMLEYDFPKAGEMRSRVMSIIHDLETELVGNRTDVATGWKDDYKKEIVTRGDQFCVTSADGNREFGCYKSREQAVARLRQIEYFSEKLKQLDVSELMLALELKKDTPDLTLAKALVLEELNLRKDYDPLSLVTISKSEQRYTLGPVYIPNQEDAHGETIDDNTLQTSIWDWVRKGDRTIYLQHSEKPAGEMVEILTIPFEFETTLTVPNEGSTIYKMPANTPFMGVIWEDWAWELVKAGELRGYSIGGTANRIEVDLPN
jgi:hypothetical protein